MLVLDSKRGALSRLVAGGLLATAAFLGASAPASAHFILKQPAASLEQDGLGSPQKAAPCGDEGGAPPSGKVTAYQAGQTITITIDEKIYHPGHYRISLGVKGPGDLPVEPIVTPGPGTPCGTAPIEKTPAFPVLADGVFIHTAAFSGPQTFTVTLPPDVTCDHCTLQVLEFMSEHPLNDPGGCYYHHCADISIQAGPVPDGGISTSTAETSSSSGTSTTGAGGASATGGSSDGESSGCRFTGITSLSPGLAGLAGLAGLVALMRRRRRQ